MGHQCMIDNSSLAWDLSLNWNRKTEKAADLTGSLPIELMVVVLRSKGAGGGTSFKTILLGLVTVEAVCSLVGGSWNTESVMGAEFLLATMEAASMITSVGCLMPSSSVVPELEAEGLEVAAVATISRSAPSLLLPPLMLITWVTRLLRRPRAVEFWWPWLAMGKWVWRGGGW